MPVKVFAVVARLASLASLGALGCVLAGCAGSGAPVDAFAQAGSGPTVAFESIDGPPPQVFDRMVSLLDSESRLRNVLVVSRQGSAAYRVRGYLAAQVRGSRTSISWVWDVYDRDQQRALRLSGEEQTTGKSSRDSRNAWASADDVVLRRIAQAGFSGLSGIISGSTPAEPLQQPAPAPRGAGPALAGADAPTTRTADAGAGLTTLGFGAR